MFHPRWMGGLRRSTLRAGARPPAAGATDPVGPAGIAGDGTDGPAEHPGRAQDRSATGPARGPYDVDDAPNDGVRRLDLGALLVPASPGVTYRFRTDPESGRVVAVLLAAGGSTMELVGYAAPRNHPVWDEVRAELVASPADLIAARVPAAATEPAEPAEAFEAANPVEAIGAIDAASALEAVREVVGEYGPELRMRVSTAVGPRSLRVLGIDGPRWFLRAVVLGPVPSGPGAGDDRDELLVDALLRQVIVLRGGAARPRRSVLPLQRPTDRDGFDEVDRLPENDGDGPAGELGRIRPTGSITLDARRVTYEMIAAPVGSLSRNLSTWG